jgi:hypothetical protein
MRVQLASALCVLASLQFLALPATAQAVSKVSVSAPQPKASEAVGASKEKEQKAKPSQTSSRLVIEIAAQPRQIELPGAFSVTLRVQNTTTNSVVLQGLHIRQVDVSTRLELAGNCLPDGKAVNLAENQSVVIACDGSTPDYNDNFWSFLQVLVLGRWSLLTMAPADYQFVASATAEGVNLTGPISIASSKLFTLRLVPTVWQAVIGAFAGSFLMVIFWLCSPLARSRVRSSAPDPKWWRRTALVLWVALKLWIGSAVAAAIAIFLTFRMKDSSLPFTLSVNDYYGGLVAGLFGVALTHQLGHRLFGGDKDDPSSGARKSASDAAARAHAAPAAHTAEISTPVPPAPLIGSGPPPASS